MRPDDFEALFRVAADPLIWEQHPERNRYEEATFRAFFADALASGGALVALDRATGEIIGSSRYHGHDPAQNGIEIGWSFLARAYWGKGHNAEFKRLMLEHAFRYVDRVVFRVGAGNVISRKAMARIGGRLTGVTFVEDRAGRPVEHVVYEITRESFAAGPLAR